MVTRRLILASVVMCGAMLFAACEDSIDDPPDTSLAYETSDFDTITLNYRGQDSSDVLNGFTTRVTLASTPVTNSDGSTFYSDIAIIDFADSSDNEQLDTNTYIDYILSDGTSFGEFQLVFLARNITTSADGNSATFDQLAGSITLYPDVFASFGVPSSTPDVWDQRNGGSESTILLTQDGSGGSYTFTFDTVNAVNDTITGTVGPYTP
ncbi:MAG: hypothetical protein MI724_05000 [Spirochaetales bacterium]|nr:hypothetical protein [Spirochaetales bacterium]